MNKYLKTYNLGLQTNFIYRWNFMMMAVAELCPLITNLLVWNAIFSGFGKTTIHGYDHLKIITYILLSFPVQRFVGLWFMDYDIANDIREGRINMFLLRPLDYLRYRWTLVLGRKTIVIGSILIPYLVFFFFLRHSLMPPASVWAVLNCLVICLLGLYLNFLITYCGGLIAFWLLDVSSLFFIYYILSFFLSGGMFPLDILPGPIYRIMEWLPFQFMGYYQIKVYLGDYSFTKTMYGILTLAGWIVLFSVITEILWKRGTRKYSAYGG